MLKIIKRTLIVLLCTVLTLLAVAAIAIGWGHFYRTTYKWDPAKTIERTDTEEDIRTIVAKGKALYDEEGKLFQIKGINFGNLLISEGWMTVNSVGALKNEDGSYQSVNDQGIVEEYEEVFQEEMDEILKERFTEEQIEALNDAYFYSYCTEQDFINIKEIGMNTVRLPMYYRNFMEGEDEALTMKENPFEKVDYFLELAKKYDLRVILDMHGVVGGQSGYEHSGTRDIDFWENDTYIEAMCTLWREIAEHYVTSVAEGGRADLASTILAYDLVNEPTNKNEIGTGELQWEVMDRLYDAIRAVDEKHVISIEGVWYFNSLPDPDKYGWENVLYQYHFYNWSHDLLPNWLYYDLHYLLLSFSDYDVPKFIGEFNFFGDKEEWLTYLNCYDQTGLGWTVWSYKIVSVGWWDSSWGMCIYKMDLQNDLSKPLDEYNLKLDIRTATYEEIYAEWSTQFTDDGVNNGKYKFDSEDSLLCQVIKEYFAQQQAEGEGDR